MGKRKYDNDKSSPSKENATSEEAGAENNEIVEQPDNTENADVKRRKVPKTGGFDIKHLRKDLAAKQGQGMVLTQFLQVCLDPDNEEDYLLAYLKTGGNPHEILRQINQDSKKNLTLTTPAFHLFHLIIVKVQSSLPHMIAATEEACRYFLNNFMSTVEIMISENSGPRHRKIILKLLTSMVTLNSDLGIEILSHAPLTPKHLQYIVEKSNYKEKDNVRTSFVHFMTSFLVDGHLPLIKALLEKQGLLSLVIPGLVHDEAEAVLIFLNILKKNVVENSFISKSLKLKTFNHQVLHNLFKIFTWKGPPEINFEVRNKLRPEIVTLLSDIILTLFTSHRLGLYFIDSTLGTSDLNKNQNLYKALLTLKRPWENNNECQVILEIIHRCPDLHRAVMSVVEQSFEPQHSPIWEKTVEFVINLLENMKPENVVPKMKSLNTSQAANFVRFVTLPVPLLKYIQTSLGKDQSISLYCIKVLVKMLQTLKRYMQIFEMDDSSNRILDLKNKLEYFLPKHLPVPATIVTLIQDVINYKDSGDEKQQDYKLPKIEHTDALINLIDVLLLYNDIHPAFFEMLEGNIDMKQILKYATKLKDGNTALLKFKIVSLWLTLDRTAISLKNPMFKDLFLIMLDVYTTDTDTTWSEAKITLHNFFRNTSIFERDEDEIHLILYALRNAKVNPISLIADIVEFVLSHIQELANYVSDQIVNFEITDEGSESSLNKLFDDLMENQNTDDQVFLENKIPSTFIVGCMQFIQNNKEAKKSLKHFLSCYIAHLFHCNYSPELTELLIEDSKLEVRNYVSQWLSQSASLPESITAKDDIIKALSKSIFDNEDLPLQEVFRCLEETSAEESDITIHDVPYKVITTDAIDSSEILIWAKYLIFCLVRLTNIGQLDEDRQKKIINYFHLLITIGKKSHLINECRLIMLSLFKNPHVLKIYKPLSVKENDPCVASTQSLLDIVVVHRDVVTHLDNKHRILKSYQQKNFNELVKAFSKINKRKNLSSELTVKVLEVVGMTNEDDLVIFNKIFALDANYCVKDDKEPSIVLDVLQTLLNKYSKSITIEMPEHVIRKSMKMYAELISNKEVTANLTNLENSLTVYFENKPHHSVYVNDDIYKRFFNATTIRKSTSKLASVLLKYNMRFCNIYKEQISRPEILSQRELTLPLGNAIIHHKQFLIENRELLPKVFAEYKSNTNKMLEKPHKAGQIYNSCWEFIRKLLLECLDVKECVQLFSKSHKYEVAESSHVQLLQAVFFKICLHAEHHKKEYLMNYLSSMLHIMTIALKENKDTKTLDDIIGSVYNVVLIVKRKEGFKIEQKDEFKKVTESAVWQNFCKAVLKDSLKVRTVAQSSTPGPQLLFLLTTLVKLLYSADSEDIVTLFDMVTSHSEFLNVMLSHHSSDIKSRLVEFLYTLIQLNKSVMKLQQIPVYLSAYHATRSPCDRLILAILQFYESNGQAVNEYKPYVFGDSAANHYAVRKTRTSSLWGHPTPNRLFNLFDKETIERTVRNFPVMQRLEYNYELPPIGACQESLRATLVETSKAGYFNTKPIKDTEAAISNLLRSVKYDKLLETNVEVTAVSHLEDDEGVYDAAFVFPLLSHLLAPGSVASCFKMMRSGLLALPVVALGSHCELMRAAAYHVLHRFCLLLETETRHKNDKLFLTDFISTIRQSLPTAISDPAPEDGNTKGLRSPRLPAVDALYLARALMVSTAPFDPLYKPVNNFFIAKELVDLTVVPDFLSLFHDSDVVSTDRRLWILDVIRDGTKTMTDINVIFKTMSLKMIMDFYSSVLSDRKTKERILGVLNSVISVPRAFGILLEGYGFMSWLHAVVRQLGKDDKTLVRTLFVLLENMIHSMTINCFVRHLALARNRNASHVELKLNKDVECEIMDVLYYLLPHTNSLEDEDLVAYVKIYNLLSKRTLKSLTKKQILGLVCKSAAVIKDEATKLLTKAIVNNDVNVLKSNVINNLDSSVNVQSKDVLMRELTEIIQNYVA
ncbi:uncharacterized protein LOC114357936 [Ostrinia furnacalis]|uniref:uncharacterized protein LOC114357936 n=1 Tax=Ostrinia furnacalis TaxID=93504 RepID=UPI00103E6559|nr:uncharacterized protein LOC114357936 [Ostrinia furnacalis]